MKTQNTNLNELISALDSIRKEKYPEIPKELIEKILLTELDNQDNRSLAAREVLKHIEKYLQTIKLPKK